MGEPKGLVRVDGRFWIDRQLDAMAARRVVLVLGEDREHYEQAIPDLARRLAIVVNPSPERGPFSSLQAGLAAATPGEPVFVLPVDVPAPSPEVWAALEAALRAGAEAAVPVHEGRGGHPVLLSAAFGGRLRSLPPSSRLDQELRSEPSVARVPVADPRVRLNLNAPENWGKLAEGG
jgi:molybdenum cofactor cytidylyltransferase